MITIGEADMSDWNTQIIEEFRANQGLLGGNFTGAPMTLLHHRGRKSGTEYVAPVMYLQDESNPATVYVFASKAGAPTNPEWYYNLVAAGDTVIEIGPETAPVTVEEITGATRDKIYAEQVKRFPGFGEYEVKAAGARTIPVLALHRS
jgi:deazaflavin-dependent oxidoreductase (nitroreductase family)